MKTACLLLLLCVSMSMPVHGQSKVPRAHSTKDRYQNPTFYQDYSKAVFGGIRNTRIFLDDPRRIEFLLLTSWIPGYEHKGFFRYQLSTSVTDASLKDQALFSATPPSQGWGIPETIERLQTCDLFLNIYDDGGFILQKIPVAFMKTVDDRSIITGLTANDSSQMDLANYQSFLNAKSESSWDIAWACTKK